MRRLPGASQRLPDLVLAAAHDDGAGAHAAAADADADADAGPLGHHR